LVWTLSLRRMWIFCIMQTTWKEFGGKSWTKHGRAHCYGRIRHFIVLQLLAKYLEDVQECLALWVVDRGQRLDMFKLHNKEIDSCLQQIVSTNFQLKGSLLLIEIWC
jgi:hypothetical protein